LCLLKKLLKQTLCMLEKQLKNVWTIEKTVMTASGLLTNILNGLWVFWKKYCWQKIGQL
jgi:hypothetical protein